MARSRCLISAEAEQRLVVEGGEGSSSVSAAIPKGTGTLGLRVRHAWSTGNPGRRERNQKAETLGAPEAQEDHGTLRGLVQATEKLLTAEELSLGTSSSTPHTRVLVRLPAW